MSIFKYYINNKQFAPINEGEFTFDYQRITDAGAYHYAIVLNGSIKFDNAAYVYIKQHGELQSIPLRIEETTDKGTFEIIRGDFTHYDCEWIDDLQQVYCEIKQDTYYQCLLDNYDKEFNLLEVPNVVSATMEQANEYIYKVIATTAAAYELPLFGLPVMDNSGFSPYTGFWVWIRERVTTYCQGGEPQAPEGVGWELEIDNCAGGRTSTFSRKPLIFQNPIDPTVFNAFAATFCVSPCTPALPPGTNDWILMETLENPAVTGSFWLDYGAVKGDNIIFDNGRLLTDVINSGLNQDCPELDLQSQFLTNEINPVTGITPSSTEGIQVHAIDDVKFPTNSEPATVQRTTVRELFEGYIHSKLNCFWYVDERTKRLIIEHYNDLNNSSTPFDIRPWQELRNKYQYNKTDIPRNEAFPSLDVSIDFTGVDIEYDNDVASGSKSYNTDKFFSEVFIINDDPDTFPNDGIVMITPDSLAPFNSTESPNDRTEYGAITGDYRPNAPQGMANLHQAYWPYRRPFTAGDMNFEPTAFEKAKPVKVLEPVTVPLCNFFFFDPRSAFIGNNFGNGQLESATYNPKTQQITLNLEYNE